VFQGDFERATAEEIGRLSGIAGTLRDIVNEQAAGRRSGRPIDVMKDLAAHYAYQCLFIFAERSPTLKSDGSFDQLATILYEGATSKRRLNLSMSLLL
jgi:hypothetical protein